MTEQTAWPRACIQWYKHSINLVSWVTRSVSSCSSLGWPHLYLGGGARIPNDIMHDWVSGVIWHCSYAMSRCEYSYYVTLQPILFGVQGATAFMGWGWPHLRTATGQDAEETFLIFRPYRRIDFLPNLVGSISTLPHTTALETEVLALSARKFVTVCYVACEHLTSATNNFKHYWRYKCLSRPRRFVTFYIRNIL